ncbi:MAG: hypothetical protein NT031_08415, partial [Planctomycetota bacterium]|nr:hypothetical protein [Planctomycetota bacterium]
MRKQAVLGTLVSLALVLAFAASVQAAYDDAISINISAGGVGNVSDGTTGVDGFVANNWINTPYNATGLRGGNGGVLAGSTSTGTVLSAAFKLSLYTGGWGSLGAWTEASAADNTLGQTGWNVGNMSNTAWGWTRGDVQLWDIPASFAAAGYDVYALAGHSQTSLSWIKMTDVAPLTSVNPARIFGSQSGVFGTGLIGGGQPCPADNWRVAAYQILKISTATPASFSASPASPLDFGNVDVSTASTTQTVTLTNNGDTAGDVTGASITGA